MKPVRIVLENNVKFPVDISVYHPTTSWSQVVPRLNSKGRDLLQKLLVCRPTLRINAEQAMAHSYFTEN